MGDIVGNMLFVGLTVVLSVRPSRFFFDLEFGLDPPEEPPSRDMPSNGYPKKIEILVIPHVTKHGCSVM